MERKSLISSSVAFDVDGVQRGYLRLPHSIDESAYGVIPVPIGVIKRGDGPTVLLTGGVHGDEYEGPLALYEIMRGFEELDLSGRIIVVPSVNHPAFLAGRRVSPIDGLNLNRVFPGEPRGSITGMLAHYVSTVLLPMADYAFDLHSGGASLRYLPTLFAPIWEDPAKKAVIEGLVKAFAPPRVAYFNSRGSLEGEDRVFGNAADNQDCHFLTGEFGGGATVDLEGKAMLMRGIFGVLRHLGLLSPLAEAAPTVTRHLTLADPDLFAYAPAAGIFEPSFALGDELPAGALAGRIHDPVAPWNPPVEVRFRGAGLALCIRTIARVQPGDCLGHLARDVTP